MPEGFSGGVGRRWPEGFSGGVQAKAIGPVGLGFALAFGPRFAFAFAFGASALALSFPTLALVVILDPVTGPVGVGVVVGVGALILEVRWILSLAATG